MLTKDCHVKLSHTFREANHYVDLLANQCRELEEDLVIFEQPPGFLSQILLFDSLAVETPHIS